MPPTKKATKPKATRLSSKGPAKEKEKEIATLPLEEVAPVPMPVAEKTEDADDVEFVMPSEEEETVGGKERYYESVGRRKESVARVRLYTKKSTDAALENKSLITVNGKDYYDYFNDENLISRIEAPFRKLKSLSRFKVTAILRGGGMSGQADALRHGLARALENFDSNFRKKLKKSGYLTRDSREKERRKYGLKKARKAPQWSKR